MGVFFVAQAETRGFSMGFPRKPISDDWKLTMFVGSYTPFVVGFAKLFSIP